jgi:hypothetical protein
MLHHAIFPPDSVNAGEMRFIVLSTASAPSDGMFFAFYRSIVDCRRIFFFLSFCLFVSFIKASLALPV